MTAKKAAELLKKYNPKLDIQECRDYGSDFIFVAPAKDDESNIDPFYLVNKVTGRVHPYTVAENPSKFYASRSHKWQ